MKTKKELLNESWSKRAKLYAEGAKLQAEGDKLRAEGDKLWAEGDIQWYESLIHIVGNAGILWTWGEPNGECTVEGVGTFRSKS